MNNSVSKEEKGSITIISWKKAFTTIAAMAIVANIVAIGTILYYMSILQDPENNRLLSIVLFSWVVTEIFFMFILAHFLKKKSVDVDSSGIMVHFDKILYSVDWRDVKDIEITKEEKTRDRKAGEYYKISLDDKKDFPHSEILVEKTKKLYEEMGMYYKGKSM